MNAKEFLELCPPGSIGQKLAERYTGEGDPWPLERVEKLKEAEIVFYEYVMDSPPKFLLVAISTWVLIFIGLVGLAGYPLVSIEYFVWFAEVHFMLLFAIVFFGTWRVRFSPIFRKYEAAKLAIASEGRAFTSMVGDIIELHCLVNDVPTPYLSTDSKKPTYYEQRIAMLKMLTESCADAKHQHWHFLERAEEQMKRYAVERCRLEWRAELDSDLQKQLRRADRGEGNVKYEYRSSYRLKRLHLLLTAVFGLRPAVDVEDCFNYAKEIVLAERAEVMEFSI